MAVSASAGSSSFSTHRIAGIIGILGALLLFVGDMLLLGHLGPASDFRAGMLETIRSAPLTRLWAGGLLGPIAGTMLLAGFWQVYRSMHVPAGGTERVMFALFVLFTVGLAAIHSVWAVFELVIQSCGGVDSATATCQALAVSVQGYIRLSLLGLAVPGAIASLILAVLVLRRRTHLPRWTVVASPLLLVAVLLPAFSAAPAPIGAVLMGGFASIQLLVFFAVIHCSTRGCVQ
jgi:hypothetical protein